MWGVWLLAALDFVRQMNALDCCKATLSSADSVFCGRRSFPSFGMCEQFAASSARILNWLGGIEL